MGNRTYTGRLFEFEVFGPVVVREWNKSKFWTLSESVDEALKHQHKTWNPIDPSRRMANDLHALVCEYLKVDDYSTVRFYQSIGGPLDRFYGTDGIFEYQGNMVFIDTTLRDKGEKNGIVMLHDTDDLKQKALEIASELS